MATEKLIRASDARRAILKEDPKLAYCIDEIPGVDIASFKFEVDDITEYDKKIIAEVADALKEFNAPITNADSIREMSDEELAKWLAHTIADTVWDSLGREGIPFSRVCAVPEYYYQFLKWLKQPAEEE